MLNLIIQVNISNNMIDIKNLRQNLDQYSESCKLRWINFDFNYFQSLDIEARKLLSQIETLQAQKNTLTRKIQQDKSSSQEIISTIKDIKQEIQIKKNQYDSYDEEFNILLSKIPLPIISDGKDLSYESWLALKSKVDSIDYISLLLKRWWIDENWFKESNYFINTYWELALLKNFILCRMWELFYSKGFQVVMTYNNFFDIFNYKNKILQSDDLPLRYFIIQKQKDNYTIKLNSFVKPQDVYKEFELYGSIVKDVYKEFELPFKICRTPYSEMILWSTQSYDIQVYCPYDESFTNIWNIENNMESLSCDFNLKYKKDWLNEYLNSVSSVLFDYNRLIISMIQNLVRDDLRLNIPKVFIKQLGKDLL